MRSPGLWFNNPLLQRIRRHRTMATLYRSVVEEGAGAPQPTGSPAVAPDRVPIPQATLLSTSSTLPEGRVFAIAESTWPDSPAGHRPVAPAPAATPVQTQRVQRQETTSSPVPAEPEGMAGQPISRLSPGQAKEQPSREEDFDWISDQQWDALKSFMEGHQEKLAREITEEESAEIRRSPEEIARKEAREKARAELARRQEMARSGHLPRAKVEYVSEKSTPEQSRQQTTGEGLQRSAQELDSDQEEAQVDEAKKRTQEPTVESMPPPAEPVPPTAVDQTSGPATGDIQRQVQRPTKEQQRSGAPQESEPVRPASRIPEVPTGEEMIESLPSRPVEQDLDFVKETPSGESPIEVGGRIEPTITKPATIRREPTEKLPEVEPAGSQPAIEVEDQITSESTISPHEPPGEQEAPGLGRRLLDAARSLFGREETALESEKPAGELPASPPIEAKAPVQRESTASVSEMKVQLQPLEEEPAETLAEIEGEKPAPSTDKIRPQGSSTKEVVADKATGPEPSKEIPSQIQRDDRMASREAEEEGVAAEEEPQAETAPSLPGEIIARQEEAAQASLGRPPDKPVKIEPESGISDDLGMPELQEIPDITSESHITPTGTIGDKTLVQAADRVPEAESGVEDLREPAEERSEKEGEDVPDIDALESAGDEKITQALPLEKAWPVQELRPPKEVPPSMTGPAETKKTGKPAQRKPAGDDGFVEEVHKATKDVSPGKPSDSSIELVTPRRPRPSQPPAPRPAPDVQRKPPESRQPDLTQPEPAVDSDPLSPEKKPYFVPTEIGDLPSDFWQMLGEKPPRPREMGPSIAQADATTAAQVLQKMPETNGGPAQVAEMPSPLVTQEFPDPFVQRAVSIREIETVSESEPEEAGTAEEPKIDVDQLAREVFPEIKRKLKVEWERGRGRF